MRIFLTQISLLFIIVSCGKSGLMETKKTKSFIVESQFLPYLESFEEKSAQYRSRINVTNVIIKMTDTLGDRIMAQCLKYTNDALPPKITVSKVYWDKISEASREELMFHEFGHCILGRPHRNTIQNDGSIPYSIMYPYHLGHTRYLANYDQYQHELFRSEDLVSALPLVTHVGSRVASSSMSEYIFAAIEFASEAFESGTVAEASEPEEIPAEGDSEVAVLTECEGHQH